MSLCLSSILWDFDFQIKCKFSFYLTWLFGYLGPLQNRSVHFLLSPAQALLSSFLVQEWLDTWNSKAVACVMQTSVCGDSWCSHTSSVTLAWQSSQGCGHTSAPFPATFSLPLNTIHLLRYWTLWASSFFFVFLFAIALWDFPPYGRFQVSSLPHDSEAY